MTDSPRDVSLAAVAEAAGVSIATASRALSGRGDLKKQTRERVLAAAAEVGYNRVARPAGRPRTHDSRLIEFVLGTFDDAWTDAMMTGARKAAFALGYDLVLTLEREDPSDDWPARVATRRPSGVVLGIIQPTHKQLDELRALRIPIVLLEPRSEPDETLVSVGTTDWQGGYEAGRHLALSGCDRFVVLTGTPRYRFGRARDEGFRRAIEDLRPNTAVVHVESQWSDAPVSDALVRALTGDAERIGVFACNDEMAVSVYRAAHRLGRRIPDDVSVIGFNDEPRAARLVPPLSTIHQPLQEMAGRAVELVNELHRDADAHHGRAELPSTLVLRGSTLPAGEAA